MLPLLQVLRVLLHTFTGLRLFAQVGFALQRTLFYHWTHFLKNAAWLKNFFEQGAILEVLICGISTGFVACVK